MGDWSTFLGGGKRRAWIVPNGSVQLRSEVAGRVREGRSSLWPGGAYFIYERIYWQGPNTGRFCVIRARSAVDLSRRLRAAAGEFDRARQCDCL
jgi:hypothetical protein